MPLRPGRCSSVKVPHGRVLLLGSSFQLRRSIGLDLGDGRLRRLRHTEVQDELVAGEAGPRAPRAGAGWVLRKGMHFPSCEGAPSQGISDGLGCGLASRRPRAPLRAEVAMESASHAEPPAIVLGGVVPDCLVATLPLASPPGLVRFVPYELGSARPGATSKAATARTRQGPERVPGPLVVCNLGAGDAPVTLHAMGGDEVGPHTPAVPHIPGWGGGTSWGGAGPGHVHGPHLGHAGLGPVPWAGQRLGTPLGS